eukprot:gene9476-8479_t
MSGPLLDPVAPPGPTAEAGANAEPDTPNTTMRKDAEFARMLHEQELQNHVENPPDLGKQQQAAELAMYERTRAQQPPAPAAVAPAGALSDGMSDAQLAQALQEAEFKA